jgi:polyphenol oxidase
VQRRRPEDDVYVLVAPGLERRGVLAAFTERTGGESVDPFRSLNLGYGTGDTRSHVRRNRDRAAAALRIPPFTTARQAHGIETFTIDRSRAGGGFDDPTADLPTADILVTKERGVPLAVLTADCLPVALASDDVLVLVHAGWRGLAAGILDRAVQLFTDPSEIVTTVGPAIGPCHYEVGADVADAVAAGSPVGVVQRARRGRRFLDLPATAAAVLAGAGVKEVEVADLCTACHEDRFFSYRRDGVTGRQAAIVMRM